MPPKGFSICNWYSEFEIFTTATVLIQLNEKIIEYLLQDRIILPNDDIDFSDGDDDDDNDSVDNEEIITKQFLKSDVFQQFYEKIHATIQFYNNAVFVKSNWRSPQDAKWISPGRSLKVESVNDLLLLLKSSEIIRNDFRRHLHSNIEKPILAIRKWINIHPGAEFRCVIFKKTLVGISPRDWPTFYEHFDRDGLEIVAEIDNFFIDNIKDVFLYEDSYVMDIVRLESEPIMLIDFGPLNGETELYAFSYTEIMKIPDKDLSAMKPVFRYVSQNTGIHLKSNHNPVCEDLKDYLKSNSNKQW